ncbi:MAG: (Fe-S)-binding protein [Desulfofustis sp.]
MNESTPLERALATIIDDCTECGGCVRQCAFLRRYGNPLQLATQYREGTLSPEVIYSCSLCRLCDVHCPEALNISEMLWLLRCRLVEEGRGPLKQHRRILNYEKIGLSSLFQFTGIPDKCDTVFYPGCALVGTRPTQVQKLSTLLKQKIDHLGIVLNCCAKPSYDLGRKQFFDRVFSAQLGAFKERGISTVITACPSCHQIFSRYAKGMEVKSVYQILDDPTSVEKISTGRELCIHDPCSTRFDTEVHQSVRSIVEGLGLAAGSMKHQRKRTLCCGEGGSASFVAPEITDQWAEQRAEQAGGRPVLTYCAGCVHFLSGKMTTIHLVDVMLDPEAALAGKAPASRWPFTYLNRLLLKHKLGTQYLRCPCNGTP